jgi:hypothetical protein
MGKKLLAICSTLLSLLWYLSLGLSSSSCAQIVNPTGGPRDTIPPILDTLLSSPNEVIRFEKQDLYFTFDEFLNLQSPAEQVIITPPLDYNFEVELKKFKTVIFKFAEEEILKEDVTYSINFGNAIKDYTEGNVYDLRYVFSTGDYIDSLELKGKVLDAFSNEPVDKTLVMLYTSLQDSVVRTEKPFYFTKTDNQGLYHFKNLRADTFKLIALVDKNVNYLFDLESEFIGFIDSAVVLTDSFFQPIQLDIFQEVQALKIIEKDIKTKGVATFTFNREPDSLNISIDRYQNMEYILEEDQLQIWYNPKGDTAVQVILDHPNFRDTFYLSTADKSFEMEKHVIRRPNSNMSKNKLLPNSDLQLIFEEPINITDSFNAHIYVDSIFIDSVGIAKRDTTDHRIVWIPLPSDTFKTKILQFLPGSFTTIHEKKQDSLKFRYEYATSEVLSGLTLSINGLDSTLTYQGHIKLKEAIIESFSVDEKASYTTTFTPLFPGEYTLELIEDKNRNGAWDTGNYNLKEHAEKRRIFTLEKLRENWEVESIINWE